MRLLVMVKGYIILAGKILLWLIVAANIILLLSGRTWVYKALVYNYVNIDDHLIFDQREIKAGNPRPWPLSVNYNKVQPDSKLLNELQSQKSVAYLVIQRDSILFESYWDGYNDSSISNSFSMSKSVVGALTGIALKDGVIKSIDQKVADFIPEYMDDPKGKLSIRQLLTMSAALSWDEAYTSLFSVTTEAYYGKDLKSLIDRLKVNGAPGKEFYYQGGATQLLAMLLMKATGQSISEYASLKLWRPIGAEHPALWSLDKKGGMEKASCCIYSNARDFARIGALYLHQGNAYGQQLIDTSYVRESLMPAPLTKDGKPNTEYGFQWWITSQDGEPVYYCRGILGQYIAVIPSRELIVVRLGHQRHQAEDGTLLDLPVYLEGAIRMTMQN